MTMLDTLGITLTLETPCRVEGFLTVAPALAQPYGVLHGGATLSLLETVASRGAELRAVPGEELPFGVRVDVRHRKPALKGIIRGVAELEREEPARTAGKAQFWHVTAYDEAQEVISEGLFETRVVPRAYLAAKGIAL